MSEVICEQCGKRESKCICAEVARILENGKAPGNVIEAYRYIEKMLKDE